MFLILFQLGCNLASATDISPIVGRNVLGLAPLFCRNFSDPTDDKSDEELKELVDKLTAKSTETDPVQLGEIQRVIRLTAMKKLWSLESENNRIHIYLSSACEGYELNKWPSFTNKKALVDEDAKQEEKHFSDFIKICSAKFSSNDLAPFLSKDVLNESLTVLTKIYPQNYGNVKNYICGFFNTLPQSYIDDTVYENFVLEKESDENLNLFSKLLMDTKLSANFQLQGRQQTLQSLLSPDEVQSIKNYTDKSFAAYNTCLRDSKTCTDSTRWGVEKIKSALGKIKNASRNSNKDIYFRGAHSLPEPVLKKIRDGISSKTPIVLDNAFLSTSGLASISKRFAGHFSSKDVDGIIFVIKSRNCGGIASLSPVWDEEDEFLCPPAMKFIIKDTGVRIPVDPGIGGLRPGELPHTPSKVYYLDEVE